MKSYIAPSINCCPSMTRAREEGTDAEGYTEAVCWNDEYRNRLFDENNQPENPPRGEFYLGNLKEQPIKFCPYCGHEITESEKHADWDTANKV